MNGTIQHPTPAKSVCHHCRAAVEPDETLCVRCWDAGATSESQRTYRAANKEKIKARDAAYQRERRAAARKDDQALSKLPSDI